MPHVRTRSIVLAGTQGYPIDVEADPHHNDPRLTIIGLPNDQAQQTTDRIRTAMFNSGIPWPNQKLTVGLFPTTIPKTGPQLDLPIATAILAAADVIPRDGLAERALIGELDSDGRLRPGRGVLTAVLAATDAGMTRVAVPAANATEAALASDITVDAVPDLAALIRYLRGQEQPTTIRPSPAAPTDLPVNPAHVPLGRRYRLAAEIAAAGGHHLLLTGGTPTAARMLAETVAGLRPPLTGQESLEVTAIHSAAGSLPPRPTLISRPPLLAPHHTTTAAALFGTGIGADIGISTSLARIRPGIASQAHHGLLLLTDGPELPHGVLQGLEQPLALGHIRIPTPTITLTLPADFQLIVTSRPCPCRVGASDCACAPSARHRYLARIPAQMRAHCDLRLTIPHSQSGGMPSRPNGCPQESTTVVAARVAQAREAMAARLRRTPWRRNAQLPRPILERFWPLPTTVVRAAQRTRPDANTNDAGQAEATRILRIAWTLADLAGLDRPGIDQVDLAHELNSVHPGS
ncbi:YifB family Mg chelatase-like AAA ATPase [Parafrankia sp. EUN1f]|uniref:YifB family Mg chelatase-like AAA ATPase n=1 Tax=Parafrankia sp. EUN1f TaxID=102897 RepID=UPI0001C47150|nr:ATP-binding protein [Parafrankia sp. EUN1f]EFC79707.1 magnesium chelatase ChlI subunit [Parafrankia sp. EUN1f]